MAQLISSIFLFCAYEVYENFKQKTLLHFYKPYSDNFSD